MLALSLKKSTIVRSNLNIITLRLGLKLATLLRPAAALEMAERWFMKPPRHTMPAIEETWMRRATTAFVPLPPQTVAEWTGQRIAVHRWGPEDAPAVLLVHGWGGRSTQLWPFIQPLLDAGHAVLGVDASGHGYSDGHSSSLPQFVAGLSATMNRPLAGVIAHSLGGAATALALRAGLSAERVVLIAPPVDLEAYSRQFARIVGLPERLRQRMQRRFERRLQIPWDALDPRPAVSDKADVAALVIHDRHDPEVPFEAGMSLADHWPGSQRLVTSHLGHRRILRDPYVVDTAVAFITQDHAPRLNGWHFWMS